MAITFTALKNFHWNPLEPITQQESHSYLAGHTYSLPDAFAVSFGWNSLIADGFIGSVVGLNNPRSSPITLTYNANLTPNMSDGELRTIALSGPATLHPPSNPVAGMRWEGWFTAVGGDQTLIIDIEGGIKLPSDSSFSGTRVIPQDKMCIVMLKYTGSSWLLCVIEGDY